MRASDLVGLRVREIRDRRGWTARQLAERCAEIGAPEITTAVIANIETGRRDKEGRRRRDVTVEETLSLAYALDVPPLHLLSPLNRDETLEIAPGIEKDPIEAADWTADDGKMLGAVQWAGRVGLEETALRQGTDPLVILRMIRVIIARIRRSQWELTDAGWRARHPGPYDYAERAIVVLGGRLLHLLDSLAAFGYEPPELPDVMKILQDHGVLRKEQDEAPGAEMSYLDEAIPGED